jgi:hypothetical protein
MPAPVRWAHLIEILTSNVMYALFIGWWLYLPVARSKEQQLPIAGMPRLYNSNP